MPVEPQPVTTHLMGTRVQMNVSGNQVRAGADSLPSSVCSASAASTAASASEYKLSRSASSSKAIEIQAFVQRQSNCETRIESSQEKLSSPSLPLPADAPLSSLKCPQLHYCHPQEYPGGQGDSNACAPPHETFYLLTVLLSFPAEKPRYSPMPILVHSLASKKTFPSHTNRFSFLRQMSHFPP